MKAQKSSLNVLESDPFIGQLVGFSCNTDVGQVLITSFASKWVDEAICKLIYKVNGHIVGIVMRKSKGKLSNHKAATAYDIAWEHTSFGESSISSSYLLNGCIVDARIVSVRQQQPISSQNNENFHPDSMDVITSPSAPTRKRKRGITGK
jgi:hypothetical protein